MSPSPSTSSPWRVELFVPDVDEPMAACPLWAVVTVDGDTLFLVWEAISGD